MIKQCAIFVWCAVKLVAVFYLAQVILRVLWQKKKKNNNEEDNKTEKERMQWVEPEPEPEPKQNDTNRGDFERIVDFALRYIAHRLVCSSEEQPIPDVNHSCPVSMGLIKTNCHLRASKGVLKNLSTLHRDSRAFTDTDESGKLVLNAAAGVRSLLISFRQYSLRLAFVKISGELEVEVCPVTLRACVALSPPFTIELRSLRLESMGDIRLRPTGLGVLGPLLPYLEGWLNDKVSPQIQALALGHLQRLVEDTCRSFSSKVQALPQLQLFPKAAKKICGTVETPKKSKESKQKKSKEKKDESEKLSTIRQHAKIPANAHLFFASVPVFMGDYVEHKQNRPLRLFC